MRRILATVRVPKFDKEANREVRDPEDPTKLLYEERAMYIHHWGLQYESIAQPDGTIAIGQYTVAICEDQETHQVHTFMPTELKITGLTTYY